MARIEARGITFDVQDVGEGGPTLVFIHGWAGDRAAWGPQIADLSRDHRCLAMSLRGCGETEAVAPYDTSTAARDVIELMETCATGPVVLIAHSLGGLVALLINDLRPDLVLGIVLGDSPLTAASGGGFSQTVRMIRDAGSMDVIAEPVIERFFVETTPDEIREYVRSTMLACPPVVGAGMIDHGEIFVQKMGQLLKQADQKPLMAIWGARPLGNPERIREACPLIRQEPMGDVGHFFQLEAPAITTALLRAFLDDVREDPRLAVSRK